MADVEISYLHKIFRLDAKTGEIFWRERDAEMIPHTQRRVCFNNRHAGTRAGAIKSRGWMEVTIDGRDYRVHRVIFAMAHGRWPTKPIDHINHVRSDNRPENLREVYPIENSRNRSPDKRNRTGVCGVFFHEKTGTYKASLGSGIGKNLGTFATLEEARTARSIAMRKNGYHPNHGKDARLAVVDEEFYGEQMAAIRQFSRGQGKHTPGLGGVYRTRDSGDGQ